MAFIGWNKSHIFQSRLYWAAPTFTLLLVLLPAAIVWLRPRASRSPPKVVKSIRKPRTYRVCGIPISVSEGELRAQLEESRSPQAASYLTLAPESRKRSIATVTCLSPPNLSNIEYVVDTDFFGVTPLVSPADALVDIIAVPGLGSHALGSFRSSKGSSVWLRDFVPDNVPTARVLLYGYNTQLAKSKSRSSIGDLAKAFLESILAFRAETEANCRPIVFIGHSLGGLLIKEALALAVDDSRSQDKNNFLRSAHGIMFFGVPNLGLRQDQLKTIVSGQPNELLINDLVVDNEGEPSPYLKELTQKFVRCCRAQNPTFEIISYYERETSPTLKVLPDGRLQKTGSSTLLVTQDSAARIGLEDNFHQHLPLDTDHSGLVKFDRHDSNYLQVGQRLKELAAKTRQAVSDRFAAEQALADDQHAIWRDMNQPSFSHVRDSGFVAKAGRRTLSWLSNGSPINSIRILGVWDDSSNDNFSDVASNTDSRELLEGDAFDEDAPEKDAYQEEHLELLPEEVKLQRDEFLEWRDSDVSRCLLVTGPPGRGKSVVTNSVVDQLDKMTTPPSDTLAGCKVIYHFCSIKIENTFQTAVFVLRTLIVQLCHDRRLFERLPGAFQMSSKEFHSASIDILQGIFRDLIITSHYKRIYCIIDGLDVYPMGMDDFISFLKSVYETCSKSSGPSLKIFCTSRPETSVLVSWGHLPSVDLQADPRDLNAFVQRSVGALPDYFDTRMKNEILHGLYSQTGRTFLWIDIMVREIRRLGIPTMSEIKRIIHGSSKDLDKLYKDLVSKALDESDLNGRILLWVVYATQPLYLDELSDAVSIDLRKEYENYQDLEEDRPHLNAGSIRWSLGTLLDVIDDKAYLIHQSLKDFFKRADPLKGKPFLQNRIPRLFIAESCMIFLALEDFNDRSQSDDEVFYGAAKVYPLLRYAAKSWDSYIERPEEVSELLPLLKKITDRRRDTVKVWFSYRARSRVYGKLSEIVAVLDIGWLAELLMTGAMEGFTDEFTTISLLDILRLGALKVLRVLLDHRDDERLPEKDLCAILKNAVAVDAIALLLARRRDQIQITKGLLEAAAKNTSQGERLMEILLDYCGKDLKISQDIIQAAALNYRRGSHILTLLLNRRGSEFKITESIVQVAASSFWSVNTLTLLLDRRGDEFKITESILQAAAGSNYPVQALTPLLDRRGDEFKITESIVQAAAGSRHSVQALALLLDRRGDEFEITESFMQDVFMDHFRGEGIMTLLLERCPGKLYAALEKLGSGSVRVNTWEWWETFERDTLLPRLRLESPETLEYCRRLHLFTYHFHMPAVFDTR